MTPDEAVTWKRELVPSLEAVVARFNVACAERPEHSIEPVDSIRNVFGVRIVKPQHPSCYLELEFHPDRRRPTVTVEYTRQRNAQFRGKTQDTYEILSPPGQALLLNGYDGPLNADDFAETLIRHFEIPAN